MKFAFLISLLFILVALNTALKADNIAIYTIPKSGSLLMGKTIGLIAQKDKTPRLGKYIPVNTNRVYIDHLWPYSINYRNSPDWKKILLIRDPRDILISMMYWTDRVGFRNIALPSEKDLPMFRALSEDEKITYLIQTQENALGVYYFVNRALEWMHDPDITVIRFEDLVGEQGGGNREKQFVIVKYLSELLGYSYTENELFHIADQLFGESRTFRKGMIGSWKEKFSKEHKQLFKEKMGDLLIQLGYEIDYNW